jgi:hypothetical protein
MPASRQRQAREALQAAVVRLVAARLAWGQITNRKVQNVH